MNLNSTRIFKLDIETNSVMLIDQSVITQTDLAAYLEELVDLITKNPSGRLFKYERDTIEIKTIIDQILSGSGSFDDHTHTIADRLLVSERKAQANIEHLDKKIQKGLLFISVLTMVDRKVVMICKSDDIEILNEETFKRVKGLPIKKQIFKAFLYTKVTTDDSVTIKVLDTNSAMAKYWWRDFLEVSEIFDNESNTRRAFDAVDVNVFGPMKKNHPRDYMVMRNSAIRYFKGAPAFEIEDFITTVIGDYQPFDEGLDVDAVKAKIRELPEKKNFDTQFDIVSGVVKARFKGSIALTKQIDLVIKEDIDIDNTIKPILGDDGTKYIQIRTDEGYRFFDERRAK